MKIAKVYSHLNGLEFLQVQRAKLWDEVNKVISSIDIEACRTQVHDSQQTKGELMYSPSDINRCYSESFTKSGWQDCRIYSRQTDFIKDRVVVGLHLDNAAFGAYGLFVKHLAFYIRDEIDVGIEILAMKSMQQDMSSGPGYYEGELYNVLRNGRGVPGVPLVMVGVAE